MQALIEGGLQRVRRPATRYPEGHISHHHGEPDHTAFLERSFVEALSRVTERLERAQARPSDRDM